MINPSGILFGPNASLDVSGSFYASTAHYVRLADGDGSKYGFTWYATTNHCQIAATSENNTSGGSTV